MPFAQTILKVSSWLEKLTRTTAAIKIMFATCHRIKIFHWSGQSSRVASSFLACDLIAQSAVTQSAFTMIEKISHWNWGIGACYAGLWSFPSVDLSRETWVTVTFGSTMALFLHSYLSNPHSRFCDAIYLGVLKSALAPNMAMFPPRRLSCKLGECRQGM